MTRPHRRALQMVIVFAVVMFTLMALLLRQVAALWDGAALATPSTTTHSTALLPRYEADNGRLVLVDWRTGQVVRALAGDLAVGSFTIAFNDGMMLLQRQGDASARTAAECWDMHTWADADGCG
jgi:hypothetical protein